VNVTTGITDDGVAIAFLATPPSGRYLTWGEVASVEIQGPGLSRMMVVSSAVASDYKGQS
jgi:hypothetical protein